MTSPVFARGISRQIALALESAFGVQGAAPGQLLRRSSFTMDNSPAVIESNEITADAQPLQAQLGVNALSVSLAGMLSPGTYKALFAALLRGTWTAGVTSTAMTDTAITINGTTGAITLSSTLTNFLTKAFKAGDVVRLSGLTGAAIGLNGVNLRTTAVTSGSMTFAPNAAAVAYTSGTQTSVALSVVGKKLTIPQGPSQVFQSLSIEAWDPGPSISQLGLGIRPTQMSLNVNPSGYATIQASMSGQTDVWGTSQVYSAATAQSVSQAVSGPIGKITYGGSDIAYITAASLQIAAAAQPVPGIGSNLTQDIFMGMISANGSLSMLFTGDTFTSDFFSQNDVQLQLYLPTSSASGADFVSVFLPRARLRSNTRTDSDRAIMRSVSFSMLEQVNGGTGTQWDLTGIVMQDSLA